MEELKKFIADARNSRVSDAIITEMLEGAGWDRATIMANMHDLKVPPPSHHENTNASQESLSMLSLALHHVFLWIFSSATMIALIVVCVVLFGGSASKTALVSYMVIAAVTMLPYGLLYFAYLGRQRRKPQLGIGKIWSLITIALHSIIAISALIVFLITLLTSNDDKLPTLIGGGTVLLLSGAIAANYFLATFVTKHSHLRQVVLRLYIPMILLLLGVFAGLTIVQFGPVKHDEDLRGQMAGVAKSLHSYYQKHGSYPVTLSDIQEDHVKISYERKRPTAYTICATFLHKDSHFETGIYTSVPLDDSFVSEYSFRGERGRRCIDFESTMPYNAPLLKN